MKTKKCSKCKETKSVDEFYARKASKDGLRGQCSTCVLDANHEYIQKYKKTKKYKAWLKDWQNKNREHLLAYRKEYRKSRPKETQWIYNMRWFAKNQATWSEAKRKKQCRNLSAHAVQYKLIAKPTVCEICGEEFEKDEIHGHHEDYTRPLEAVWCCIDCHMRVFHSPVKNPHQDR
jgi:hypothetical protein